MKQHITIEQLNELSEEGKEKLREWWKPSQGDIYAWHDGYEIEDGNNWDINLVEEDKSPHAFIEESAMPLLSIGQMIEFLFINTDKVVVSELIGQESTIRNICNDLWEAVKEKLNVSNN